MQMNRLDLETKNACDHFQARENMQPTGNKRRENARNDWFCFWLVERKKPDCSNRLREVSRIFFSANN